MPGRERDGDDAPGESESGASRLANREQRASETPPPDKGQEGRTMTAQNESTAVAGDAAQSIRRVRAGEMLGPRGILLIEHEGEVYTLRVTRNNRLILTK